MLRCLDPRVKLLAYYLPQFHAFPENDAWWGKGFTEWSNLPRGIPRFAGHYQPRVPRDLGFYTLETNEALRRQVKMAKDAGVFGFVYLLLLVQRPPDHGCAGGALPRRLVDRHAVLPDVGQ